MFTNPWSLFSARTRRGWKAVAVLEVAALAYFIIQGAYLGAALIAGYSVAMILLLVIVANSKRRGVR